MKDGVWEKNEGRFTIKGGAVGLKQTRIIASPGYVNSTDFIHQHRSNVGDGRNIRQFQNKGRGTDRDRNGMGRTLSSVQGNKVLIG